MTRIEQLISEIEEYIDGCKAQPFTNNKKIIVDKDEMEELLVELRLRIPDEIKKYQKIISNKEAILASAQEEADKTVSSARSEADGILADAQAQAAGIVEESQQHSAEMVSEHEVMQQAYQQANQVVDEASAQAQKLVDDAVNDSDNIREGAIRYTDEMLGSLQAIIQKAMEQIGERYDSMMSSLQSTYEVVTGNRNELQLPAGEAAAASEGKKGRTEYRYAWLKENWRRVPRGALLFVCGRLEKGEDQKKGEGRLARLGRQIEKSREGRSPQDAHGLKKAGKAAEGGEGKAEGAESPLERPLPAAKAAPEVISRRPGSTRESRRQGSHSLKKQASMVKSIR